jgi:hypothetical protein
MRGLDLDGDHLVARVDEVVDLHAAFDAQVHEFASPVQGDAAVELLADPMLEDGPGVGEHGVGRVGQRRGGVAHAEVEEQEARRGQDHLASAARKRLDREAQEEVFEQAAVVLDRGAERPAS